MSTTATASTGLHSGNPALSEKLIRSNLTVSAPQSMTVAGVSIKTLLLLVALVAGGAWGGRLPPSRSVSISTAGTPTRR